jgi:hypothetical protein
VAFLFLFLFLPGQKWEFFTKWTAHTWLDGTIEELRALRLTDLQAAGHRQWHTGRAFTRAATTNWRAQLESASSKFWILSTSMISR